MKIGFVSTTTMAIACLASPTDARIGSRRNLVDSSTVGKYFVDSAGTGAMTDMDTTLIEGVATTAMTTATTSSQMQEQATREQQHHLVEEEQEQQQQQQQAAEENDQGQDQPPKPLPSFDQVMHKDAPSHGMYAEGGPNKTRSFCARHNHLGPNSGCEQHPASLQGSRVGKGKDDTIATTNTNGEKDSSSFLQHHVFEAQSQHRNRDHQQHQRQKQQEREQYFDGK